MLSIFSLRNKEWVGIFGHPEEELPVFVCLASATFKPPLKDEIRDTLVPNYVQRYSVGSQSRELRAIPQLEGGDLAQYEFCGFIRKVQLSRLKEARRKQPSSSMWVKSAS